MLAEDSAVAPSAHGKSSVNNVRVLRVFATQDNFYYRNANEMYRWHGILAQRIAENVTGQRMPDSPPPRVAPAIPMGNANPSAAPAVTRPVFELSPVAWSIKAVNLKSAFLPQLREEVIVLVRYTPEYFGDNAFAKGTWVLAHLRNSIRQHADVLGDGPYPSDSRGRWDVALTPELLDRGDSESSRLRETANVRCYKARPSTEQVSEFVYSTDFGNNDIYSHTSVSHRIDVDVLQVVVYPRYAKLANALRDGLKPETIAQRKAAFQETFRRDGISPSPRR
ncbi:MAG: hypothetical protein WCB27_05940 [Thermoguttaceae bacterium]|jgi:hypothetical protein